jgi:hypothetical protein
MPEFVTVRFSRLLSAADRARLDTVCAANGAGCVAFAESRAFARTYARLRIPSAADCDTMLAALEPDTIRGAETTVLQLTLSSPRGAEYLTAALRCGAPAGLLEVAARGSDLLLEVDDSLTPLTLILELVDVELATIGEQRTGNTLLPLTDAAVARTLAHVWNAPEIGTNRILETYLDET